MKRERSKHRALCLWLLQWPLQRLRLARPELKRRELILYSPQRGCLRVVASGKRGIPMGMPLAEAMALASAHFEQHDPAADRAALLQLAAWCEQFSPIVGIEPPDNLALDITGLGPLFGGEQSLAQQVLRAIQQQGFVGQLGIADTIGMLGQSHTAAKNSRLSYHPENQPLRWLICPLPRYDCRNKPTF